MNNEEVQPRQRMKRLAVIYTTIFIGILIYYLRVYGFSYTIGENGIKAVLIAILLGLGAAVIYLWYDIRRETL